MPTPIPYIQPYLDDPAIDRILIDGWQRVYLEKQDRFVDLPSPFQNESELYGLIEALVAATGVQTDETRPLASLRLPDGTRAEIAFPPVSQVGPAVMISKNRPQPLQLEDLLRLGSLTQPAMDFMRACVEARLNIAISGSTASGKSTMLGILAGCIPLDERILFLLDVDYPGDSVHHRLPHPHLLTLATRSPDRQGQGGATLRDLVQGALRMRPDRILVEDLVGAEGFDLISAMNRGHDGCLFTLQSYNPRDTLAHLERMIGLGNPEVPLIAMREQICAAVDLIVHCERLRDGSRKIVHISEVSAMDSGVIVLRDIFLYHQTGYADGAVMGSLRATGLIPKFVDAINSAGISLPVSMFTVDDQAG
jgi:pilus assembly protein CpaF